MYLVRRLNSFDDALQVLIEGYGLWKQNPSSRFLTLSVATAAWSMTDWAWKEFTINKKAESEILKKCKKDNIKPSGKPKGSGFRRYIKHKYPALAVCSELSVAHKHAFHPGQKISEKDIKKFSRKSGTVGEIGNHEVGAIETGGMQEITWTTLVLESGEEIKPDAIFGQAITFWQIFKRDGEPQNGW